MPRPIRRSERAIPVGQAAEILQKGEFGVLSTVSDDGQPYGVPINYAYANNALYIHSAIEGHKLENLAVNNRVSFCVVGRTEVLPDQFTTRYESVIVFGNAIELFGEEKQAGLNELLKKYSSDYLEEGRPYLKAGAGNVRVYQIIIGSISGKSRI